MIPLTSPILADKPVIKHGFFTRKGGCSTGLYHALNCGIGSEDNPENVKKNRKAVLSSFGRPAVKLCGLYQIHSNIVHFVDQSWRDSPLVKGDALVTRQSNLALAILTADCAPVLLADAENGVIAAAHAGWRGALSGILENTIDMMCHHGAARGNIHAAVGPCIAQKNYQVGPEFFAEFEKRTGDAQSFFIESTKKDHYQFNLKAFVLSRLNHAHIQESTALAHDTYGDEDNFFSYRRTTHFGKKNYGRQISAILLRQA